MTDWPIEEIPSEDNLFYRAHRMHYKSGKLNPGVFKDRSGGMSTDWSKYGSAAALQDRARKPADNAVLELSVGAVRGIETLTVEHRPIAENRAHSEVIGRKDPQVRLRLRRIAREVIALKI